MTNIQTVKQQVAKTEIKPLQSIIEHAAKDLSQALPKHMRPERLVRIALTCIRLNPKLAECTPESFVGALLTSAQLGIEPVLGRGYLLPFVNRRKVGNEWKSFKEVNFLLGYRGITELFYRHEKGTTLSWGVVKEGDDFDFSYGTDSYLRHKPNLKQRGAAKGYYVISTLSNGAKSFTYMSAEECLEHGKQHSKTFVKDEYDKVQGKKIPLANPHFLADSPWVTDVDSMSLKTVLIQHGKLMPLSFEVQQALSFDESSRDYKEGVRDAMDMPNTARQPIEEAETKPLTEWEKEDVAEETAMQGAKG